MAGRELEIDDLRHITRKDKSLGDPLSGFFCLTIQVG